MRHSLSVDDFLFALQSFDWKGISGFKQRNSTVSEKREELRGQMLRIARTVSIAFALDLIDTIHWGPVLTRLAAVALLSSPHSSA